MKHFQILQGRAYVVELPERASDIALVKDLYLSGNVIQWWIPDRNGVVNEVGSADLPPGTWEIVGMLPEVTADDVSDLTGHYYNKYNERYVDFMNSSTRVTPIDDLESAIVAERYYLDKNPVPPFNERLNDWTEAQSSVLSRERCLLLRRVDQSD